MTISSWPYSTASPGSTRLAPTTPSTGATTSCGTPSMSTDAEPVAGPDPGPGAGLRPRLEDADRRRGRDDPAVVARAVAAVGRRAPSRPSRAGPDRRRAGPTGVRRAGRWRGPRRGRRGRRGRRSAFAALARPAGARRPAQADPPAALADLELAEPGRAELGDQRRQQLVAQAVDRGVVGRRASASRRSGAAASGCGRFGHSLDLLASRRLVARPRPGRRHRPPGGPDRAGRAADRRARARPGGASSGISASV